MLASSCFDPPEYPNTPSITLQDIYFKQIGSNTDADSLVLVLGFKDGDGDLGLSASEIDSPFQEQDFFLDEDGKLITVRTRKKAGYDTLPSFTFPQNCLHYLYDTLFIPEQQKSVFDESYNLVKTFTSGGTKYYAVLDTFYIQKNPNHYNIKIDFFVNGQPFDWRTVYPYPTCGETFDGRFPILFKEEGSESALEGTLTYAMKSNAFIPFFGLTKSLRLKIQIKDRALHSSNIVESSDFTLDKIKR